MPQLHVVSLGSSFAAGPGVEPIVDRAAWRSGNNYASLVARRLDARLTDLSRSGATLKNILDEPQRNMLSMSRVPPQLDSLPADADIVTITAGGNDMNYVGGMMTDAIKATVHAVPLLGQMFPPSSHEEDEIFSKEEVSKRFVSIIDRIKTVAPKAAIYLVEYLTVFGNGAVTGADNPLTEQQIKHHAAVGTGLREAYQAAKEACPDVVLVPAAELSRDHGVGAAEPWMIGFTPYMLLQGQIPFHPNAAGHKAVADLLYNQIQNDRQ